LGVKDRNDINDGRRSVYPMARNGVVWTEKEEIELLHLYRTGVKLPKMMEMLGRSDMSVRRKLGRLTGAHRITKRIRVPKAKPLITNEEVTQQRDWWIEAKKQDAAFQEAMTRAGCPRGASSSAGTEYPRPMRPDPRFFGNSNLE
jgi:hypothetical protein